MTIIPTYVITEAYALGYFPMGATESETGIEWCTARKRGIIPLDRFHIPRRVLRRIRSAGYQCKINTDFHGVITGCAERDSTWINQTIHDTFTMLHQQGLAHSVEVWRDETLCGGLYGIAIGGAFFAESVYQSEPECMKIALHFCHKHLLSRGFELWDVQFYTPFLGQFGCVEINSRLYSQKLEDALKLPPKPF